MNKKILQFAAVLFGLVIAPSLPLWAEDDVNKVETNAAAVASSHDDKAYVIGPTNLIFIKVLGESELQDKFRVDESGYITHPLLNRVIIGGKTVSEAEDMINIDRIQGKLRSSSYAKINNMVDKHPEETATILRQWLTAN